MAIQLNENQKQLIRVSLIQTMNELEAQLAQHPIYMKLQEIRTTISALDSDSNNSLVSSSLNRGTTVEYSSDWTLPKKAEFILQNSEKSELTTTEIVDVIMSHEFDLDRRKVMSGLSAVLGQKAKDKKVFKARKTENGILYSLL